MKSILTCSFLILSITWINAQELRNNFSYIQADSVEAQILQVRNLQNGNTREKIVIKGYEP